jgi:valyl-tRNA synthetase
LEIIKERVYASELTPGRASALRVLDESFAVLLRLFAPFVPHICEELWSYRYSGGVGLERSVHRSPWPLEGELKEIPPPIDSVSYDLALGGLAEARRVKALTKRSVKWPVQELLLKSPRPVSRAAEEALQDIRFAAVAERILVEVVPELSEPCWLVRLAEKDGGETHPCVSE